MRGLRGWRNALSVSGILAVLVSCASRPAGDRDVGEIDEPGSVSGKLAVYVADYADGTSETQYFLRRADGDERRLSFREHPDVAPGARVRVWGAGVTDVIDVDRFKVLDDSAPGDIGSQSSALTHPTPQAPTIFCSVLVTINGASVPANLGVDQTETQFHVGPTSVNAYYIENSYGRNSIGGKTYGPFNYNMSGCNTGALSKAVRTMVPDQCDQYGFVMVPDVASCGWGGLGEVGTATSPATDTWYNGTLGCVATVQEPGHNFGMNHSSSISCGTGVAFADDLTNCTHNEYGDKFDTMGGGCRHMNVWQKQYQGWFGGCNAVKVTSSGTFNLLPTEQACDGIQSIQIPFPNGKTRPFPKAKTDNTDTTMTMYYLEYRQALGFDKQMTPQVLVHAAPNPVTGGSRAAPHTWLINASGSSTNPGLTVGKSFADPAGGLTITVSAIDNEKATVQVDYPAGAGSAPTCLDGTMLTAPGPTTCIGAISQDGGVIVPPDSGPIGTGGTGGSGARDAGRGGGSGGAAGSSIGVGGVGQGGATGGGTAGSVGAGGEPGSTMTGPSTGTNVTVGTTSTGTGPAGAAGAVAGRSLGRAGDLDGGCACKLGTPRSGTGHRSALLVALGLVSVASVRRRRSARGTRRTIP